MKRIRFSTISKEPTPPRLSQSSASLPRINMSCRIRVIYGVACSALTQSA